MNLNFNVVKKPDKKDEEIEELEDRVEDLEEELEDNDSSNDTTSSSSSYDPKKKLFKLMGIIVFVMIILLIFLFLISSCTQGGGSVNYSYSKIESIIKNAGKSYFKDHPEYLPQDEGDSVEVEVANLVAEGKMKDLSYYTDKSCTGSVQAQKSESGYVYTPFLDCGENYSTLPLYTKVLNDNEPVSTGYGLYATNGGYAFRGETVNNYVELDGYLWRIVKINSDNDLILITHDIAYNSQVWDDRYNEKEEYTVGINNYTASRIKESLDEIYKLNTDDDNLAILSKKDKTKLTSYNLCVGKRKLESSSKNNSEECTQLSREQKIGLLTLSDYLYASIDPNCKSASSESCQNYNYLVASGEWWLMTASSESTAHAFIVKRGGIIKAEYAYKYAGMRPVIALSSRTLFKSGKGTFEKPYKVR